jgi:hypothetical protein
MNSQRTKKHKSQGIKLTGERLNMLTQDMSEKPDFQIVDLFNNEGASIGTRVDLLIPLILKSERNND